MVFHRARPHWPIIRFGPPGHGVGGGHPFLGPLFFLIIVALVVWALIVITRYLQHHQSQPGAQAASVAASPTSDAMKILNERFARGEIDPDDFTRRRDLLLQSH
jgi:putative membrane protein